MLTFSPTPIPLSNYLYGISLSLLDLLESLHGSVQSMSVVSSELGIGALEGRISVGLWLLDTVVSHTSVSPCFPFPGRGCWSAGSVGENVRTRFGEPSWPGCAETSSLTLDDNC